jgi:hypothetical protein
MKALTAFLVIFDDVSKLDRCRLVLAALSGVPCRLADGLLRKENNPLG